MCYYCFQRLIIIRNDGSLSVYNLETMKNQLETLEFVDHRLSIANTCDIDKGFLILSSKSISFRRNSSNNNLSPKELPAEETVSKIINEFVLKRQTLTLKQ